LLDGISISSRKKAYEFYPISRTVELRVVVLVASCPVSALPGIVTPFDVVKDIGPVFGLCPIVLSIHAFTFKDSEEALSGGAVGTAAHYAYVANHLVCFEKPLLFHRDKLATPIQVQNHRGASLPLLQRHEHGLDHQLTVLTRTH
jgi:hypothetical protein